MIFEPAPHFHILKKNKREFQNSNCFRKTSDPKQRQNISKMRILKKGKL